MLFINQEWKDRKLITTSKLLQLNFIKTHPLRYSFTFSPPKFFKCTQTKLTHPETVTLSRPAVECQACAHGLILTVRKQVKQWSFEERIMISHPSKSDHFEGMVFLLWVEGEILPMSRILSTATKHTHVNFQCAVIFKIAKNTKMTEAKETYG